MLVCNASDNMIDCSLFCQIVGTSKDFRKKKMSMEMGGSDYSEEESMIDTGNEGVKRIFRGFTPSTPPQMTGIYRSAKRRKGIPHRSPMGGGLILEYC